MTNGIDTSRFRQGDQFNTAEDILTEQIEEGIRATDSISNTKFALTQNNFEGSAPDEEESAPDEEESVIIGEEESLLQEEKFYNELLLNRENIVSIGRYRKYISSDSFDDNISDMFRKEAKRYWKEDENFRHMRYSSDSERQDLKFEVLNTEVTNQNSTKITIRENKDKFESDDEWKEYIRSIVKIGQIYQDHTFFLNLPFSKQLLKKSSFRGIAKTFDIESSYNFYSKNYEKTSPVVDEALHPNMYFFIEEIRNEKIRDFVNIKDPKFDNHSKAWFETPNQKSQDYFNYWKNNIIKTNLEQTDYRKIAFSDTSILNKYYSKKSSFPMNIEINFSSDGFLQFTNLLNNFGYIDRLINVSSLEREEEGLSKFIASTKTIVVEEDLEQQDQIRLDQIEVEVQSWDVMEIYNSFGLVEYNDESITFLKKDKKGTAIGQIIGELDAKLMFLTDFEKIIDIYWRRYWELLKGTQCYSEVVFYKVRKLDSQTGAFIQDIYIPNTEVVGNELKYVDCQIKYGKEYLYEIFAYCLVVGSQYFYNNVRFTIDRGDITRGATISAKESPSIKLFEIKYIEKDNVKSIDAHPMSPDMSFKQYIGIRDKILVLLNSSAGETETEFIKINDSDPIEDGVLTKFKKDDFPQEFEVYRLEIEPTNYTDFSNGRLFSIETFNSSNGSFVDIIKPEKYYYYIARTIDIHQKLSNPTIVYRIIMLEGENNNYLEVDKFDFKEEEIEYIKTMRRYLLIKPSLIQRIINEDGFEKFESAKDVGETKLGVSNDSQWDRTFKLRVRSRESKKVIDLNFSFDYEFVESKTI